MDNLFGVLCLVLSSSPSISFSLSLYLCLFVSPFLRFLSFSVSTPFRWYVLCRFYKIHFSVVCVSSVTRFARHIVLCSSHLVCSYWKLCGWFVFACTYAHSLVAIDQCTDLRLEHNNTIIIPLMLSAWCSQTHTRALLQLRTQWKKRFFLSLSLPNSPYKVETQVKRDAPNCLYAPRIDQNKARQKREEEGKKEKVKTQAEKCIPLHLRCEYFSYWCFVRIESNKLYNFNGKQRIYRCNKSSEDSLDANHLKILFHFHSMPIRDLATVCRYYYWLQRTVIGLLRVCIIFIWR